MSTKIAVGVREAAEMLSVGTRSIYRAVKTNQLPHLIFGKRIVIPIEALRAYARDAYRSDTTGNKPENAA